MSEKQYSRLAWVMCVSFALSACATNGQRNNQAEGPKLYFQSCFEGAVAGAITGGIIGAIENALDGNKKNTKPGDRTKVVATRAGQGALAGCAINMAVTAVGKLFVEPAQQKRAEEAAQREAKRKADELQRYAQAKQAAEKPARNKAEQQRRDDDLERMRAEFEKPVKVAVGDGSSMEIRTEMPASVPDMRVENSCYERTVLGTSPTGTARQKEKVCNNGQGQFVTAEVQQLAS